MPRKVVPFPRTRRARFALRRRAAKPKYGHARRSVDPRVWLRMTIVAGLAGLFSFQALPDAWIAYRVGQMSSDGCRIVSVVDGDTVRIWCRDTGLTPARLTGFDTPEVFDPQCVSELTRGTRATWALRKQLAQASRVTMARRGTDRYGRVLLRVALDGVPLARTMIADGHARPYSGGQRRGWCG